MKICETCGSLYTVGRCSACYDHETKRMTDQELVERTAKRLGEDPGRRWAHFKELCRRHQGPGYKPS